jgi:hypothetical protein
MAEVAWIVRTLVILLIIRVVMRLLMPGRSQGGAARRGRPEKQVRAGGALVRNRAR